MKLTMTTDERRAPWDSPGTEVPDSCCLRRRESAAAEEALERPLRRTDNAILLKSQVEEENEEIERVQNKR